MGFNRFSGRSVAYFSMEIGIKEELPTYSGGLGVLAGDSIRSAADLGLPMVAMTLLYRAGYFKQAINAKGEQQEQGVEWRPEKHLQELPGRTSVTIEGRPVAIRGFVYDVKGVTGEIVPIVMLDTDLPENDPEDRKLTGSLYGGDDTYRLKQEMVLGLGGVKYLRLLGLDSKADGVLDTFHMNEGHAALLTVALLEERLGFRPLTSATKEDRDYVKDLCVFTTHTPVPAGHDTFTFKLVERLMGASYRKFFQELEVGPKDTLNMSLLALNHCRYTNGVAKRHGEVSRQMFPAFDIQAITNGIHCGDWVAPPMAELFDRHCKGWRRDNYYLRDAIELPLAELQKARNASKRLLFAEIKEATGVELEANALTFGFARRAAEYKRGDLLFHDLENLSRLATKDRPMQFIFAGKAHPRDLGGKKIIHMIHEAAKKLSDNGDIKVVYVPNYGMRWGKLITGGVDIWLNNPVKPLEASGTSGMKAALNGIPSLSTLDGWWVEGCIEGVTGWEIEDDSYAFGDGKETDTSHRSKTAAALYRKMEEIILPMYYDRPDEFSTISRASIAINASFFNTQRMMEQYNRLAYRRH